jgi:hypothetical protein
MNGDHGPIPIDRDDVHFHFFETFSRLSTIGLSSVQAGTGGCPPGPTRWGNPVEIQLGLQLWQPCLLQGSTSGSIECPLSVPCVKLLHIHALQHLSFPASMGCRLYRSYLGWVVQSGVCTIRRTEPFLSCTPFCGSRRYRLGSSAWNRHCSHMMMGPVFRPNPPLEHLCRGGPTLRTRRTFR